MSGPKRNPDKLNTIGVVVVGICGAVLVYVTIVLLQAFYVNDTSEVQTMADYGGQDTTAMGHKADELKHITAGANSAGGQQHLDIAVAMKLVVADAKKDPSHLVPALPPSTKQPAPPTAAPVPTPPAMDGAAAGSGAAGSGSATGTTAAPTAPTGTGAGVPPVAGTSGAPATGGHAP